MLPPLSLNAGATLPAFHLVQQMRRSLCTVKAAAEEGQEPEQPEERGVPPGWEQAQRISADALAMLHAGEPSTAEIILKKGEARVLRAERPWVAPAEPVQSCHTRLLVALSCSGAACGCAHLLITCSRLPCCRHCRAAGRAPERPFHSAAEHSGKHGTGSELQPSAGALHGVPRNPAWTARFAGLPKPPPPLVRPRVQLWNILNDAGQHDAALEQAQAAYDLMLCEQGGPAVGGCWGCRCVPGRAPTAVVCGRQSRV